jgi:hypothetical protein
VIVGKDERRCTAPQSRFQYSPRADGRPVHCSFFQSFDAFSHQPVRGVKVSYFEDFMAQISGPSLSRFKVPSTFLRPPPGTSALEPILLIDRQSVELLFEFLKLHFCKLFWLDNLEPFKPFLKEFVAHWRPAGML